MGPFFPLAGNTAKAKASASTGSFPPVLLDVLIHGIAVAEEFQ